jgi:hypothetical protein
MVDVVPPIDESKESSFRDLLARPGANGRYRPGHASPFFGSLLWDRTRSRRGRQRAARAMRPRARRIRSAWNLRVLGHQSPESLMCRLCAALGTHDHVIAAFCSSHLRADQSPEQDEQDRSQRDSSQPEAKGKIHIRYETTDSSVVGLTSEQRRIRQRRSVRICSMIKCEPTARNPQ